MGLGSLSGEKYLPEIPGIVYHVFCSHGESRDPGVLPECKVRVEGLLKWWSD